MLPFLNPETMKFKYSSVFATNGTPLLDSRGKMVKRPILNLEITGKNGEKIEVIGVLDSGADTTTLNIQYADFLGIRLTDSASQKIMGVGQEEVPVFKSEFAFKIKGLDDRVIKVPAWYVDSKHVNILLGQEVFFEQFRVRFEKDHDTFEVIPVK